MSALKLAAGCLLLAASARAANVYLNNSPGSDLGAGINYISNDLVEAGDQITLLPGTLLLDLVTIEIFNSDGTDTISDATLRLYQVNSGVLGPMITNLTLNGMTFTNGASTTLSFNFAQVAIPNELVWTLEFSNNAGLELNLYNPPTVGSSDPTTAWFRPSSGSLMLDTFDPGPGGFYERNFNARFDAQFAPEVPEPSTLWIVGIGLCGLAYRRRS